MYKVWFGLHENPYDGYVVWDEAVNVVFDQWQNMDRHIAGFLWNPGLKIGY